MTLRRTAGAFLAVLGGLMIVVWGGLFASGQVPEVHTAPVSLAFLLAAEMTTAVLAVVSGAALVVWRPWAYPVYLLASGMMLYSITNYLGVLAEDGQIPLVTLFAGFLAGTVVFPLGTLRLARVGERSRSAYLIRAGGGSGGDGP